MALKSNIIDLAKATKGDDYFKEFDRLVPEKYVIKRHPGQYWGGSSSRFVPDMLTRISRVGFDEQRLAMWSISPEGINFNLKQVGLHLMNPKVETETGGFLGLNIPPTRIYNPVKLFMNVASSVSMLRWPRHGINLFGDWGYEQAHVIIDTKIDNNRLVKIGNEFKLFDKTTKPSPYTSSTTIIGKITKALGFQDGTEIKTLSGLGGPNSIFGIGRTRFFKSTGGGNDPTIYKEPFANPTENDKLLPRLRESFITQHSITNVKGSKDNIGISKPSDKQIFKIASDEFYPASTTYSNITPTTGTVETKYTPDKTYEDALKTNSGKSKPLSILDNNTLNNDPKYNPSEGSQFNKTELGPLEPGITLQQVLDSSNNILHPEYINRYSDIRRNQDRMDDVTVSSINWNNFEKQFTDEKNPPQNPFNDVTVYDKAIVTNKNKPYYEAWNAESRLKLIKSKPINDGTGADTDDVDQLLSEKYNKHPNSGKDKYYVKKRLPAVGAGGVSLYTKIYDFDKHKGNDKYVIDGQHGASTEDLIKFRFNYNRSDGTAGFLQFRSYLTNMSDAYNPNWEATRYIGRPDSVQKYDGFNRTFNFSFLVIAQSKHEKDVMWAKLSNLVDKVSPVVSQQGYMSSPFVYLTIGSYILDEPGYLDSLTFDISDDYPWDIIDERPLYISVSTRFIFLGKESPSHTKDYFPMRDFQH